MAIIVVGGGPRGVGKTSVAAGIIAELPQHHWTAFKITPHFHEMNCAAPDKTTTWKISEEKNRLGNSDTSRYLAAGAERAFLVQAEPAHLVEAMPTVRRLWAESKNAIIESNRVLQFVQPDLYLLVVDPASADFKESAKEFWRRADALIVQQHSVQNASEAVPGAPPIQAVFTIQPPQYTTAAMIEFVKKALKPVTGFSARFPGPGWHC